MLQSMRAQCWPTTRHLAAVLGAWAGLTLLVAWGVYRHARIEARPMPSAEAQRWALAALRAGLSAQSIPDAPLSAQHYRAAGPILSLAWAGGQVCARSLGSEQLTPSVQAAARAFAGDAGRACLLAVGDPHAVRMTVTIVRGVGPLARSVPGLARFGLVPGIEGAIAELEGHAALFAPDELIAEGLVETGATPIADLRVGVDLEGVEIRLAQQLGTSRAQLVGSGRLRRFVAGTIAAEEYPRQEPLTRAVLERAAREGALFLLRHQAPDGRYTYLYDGHTGRADDSQDYNLSRHAGTTYFLAQAARVLDMPEAREGAVLAMRWLAEHALTTCGAPDRLCLRDGDMVTMGPAALGALAAAEILRGPDNLEVRRWLLGFVSFIRSQQRSDGELMHDYDLAAQQPIDVQRMYFSGEAADALLASYRVTRDGRDRKAAERLMGHLTGAGWSFFGSRYFYGEEHWTCQAAAQAALLAHSDAGLAFCRRWLAFQRKLQYAAAQTPWPVAGSIGIGPLFVPRVTSISARTEASAMLYPVLRARGEDVRELRAQTEAALGFMLRMRWGKGPSHLLFDPEGAIGGMPESLVSLKVRNDYVQHASSAFLYWVEVLRSEEQQADLASAR